MDILSTYYCGLWLVKLSAMVLLHGCHNDACAGAQATRRAGTRPLIGLMMSLVIETI